MRTLTAILLALIAGVCRADTFAYVSLAKDRKIAVYKIEAATGELTHVADVHCEGEPGALAANPAKTALFASLRMEFTLRGAEFLWISDLSNPDRLIDLPSGFPLISSINLLPILMIVISIYQTRLMPKPTDEQQAQQMKMMKWMPILFAVVLYNYTAALALYMVVSSSVAIFESKIVKHRDEAEQAANAVHLA